MDPKGLERLAGEAARRLLLGEAASKELVPGRALLSFVAGSAPGDVTTVTATEGPAGRLRLEVERQFGPTRLGAYVYCGPEPDARARWARYRAAESHLLEFKGRTPWGKLFLLRQRGWEVSGFMLRPGRRRLRVVGVGSWRREWPEVTLLQRGARWLFRGEAVSHLLHAWPHSGGLLLEPASFHWIGHPFHNLPGLLFEVIARSSLQVENGVSLIQRGAGCFRPGMPFSILLLVGAGLLVAGRTS